MWLAGPDITLGKKALSVLRRLYGEVEIVGVTGKEPYAVDFREEGYCGGFIDMAEAERQNPDVFLMTGNQYWPFGYSSKDVCAVGGGRPSCKVLLDRIVCMPGFTVEKYERLKESRLSILSQQCYGGILSHMLDLPFLSPTVNLFMLPFHSWINFLEHPQVYLSEKLTFLSKGVIEEQHFEYPIYGLLDVNLFMNHYSIDNADLAEEISIESVADFYRVAQLHLLRIIFDKLYQFIIFNTAHSKHQCRRLNNTSILLSFFIVSAGKVSKIAISCTINKDLCADQDLPALTGKDHRFQRTVVYVCTFNFGMQ